MKETITVIKCDHCGKIIQENEVYFHGYLGRFEGGSDVHICKACTPDINRFICNTYKMPKKCCENCRFCRSGTSNLFTLLQCKISSESVREEKAKQGYCSKWESA